MLMQPGLKTLQQLEEAARKRQVSMLHRTLQQLVPAAAPP
jgi:hypothetical protein